jgi:hypothetical protein
VNLAAILVDIDEKRQAEDQDQDQYHDGGDGNYQLSHNSSCARKGRLDDASLLGAYNN